MASVPRLSEGQDAAVRLRQTGPIAWMTKNVVTANLLMFIILIGGLLNMGRVKQEVFPEFTLDLVNITVPYPGASPAEVEQGIVLAVEEAVRGLDGVKKVTSTSSEGAGSVNVELLLGADPDKVLSDVKTEVDRIVTFPEEAEEPSVTLAARKSEVISLVLYGDLDQAALHELAERARAGMLSLDGVTQVEIDGVPPLEVAIEVPRENLEAYGLTLDQVALAIRQASLERPGGQVETEGGEFLVRVSDRALTGAEFADIIVRGTAAGGELRLGDIATITDGFEDVDRATFYNGQPAVRVTAYRVGDETPISVAQAVRGYAEILDAELPDTVELAIWNDDSVMLAERIDLLLRNALQGLVLVLLVLTLFLEFRLAIWVAVGIPISFMGAFLLMPATGISINMVSLFAFIITLGMVVDDAIVVGENVYERMQQGMDHLSAAIQGAREMAVPVTFAILTTVAAFSPLFFVPGVMGKIFVIMPTVVISVLLFSLIESFFILPAHLAHTEGESRNPLWRGVLAVTGRIHAFGSRNLERFTERVYTPFLELTLRYRYIAVSAAVAMFIASVGSVASGFVPFSFFPKLEADVVTVTARLPYGAPQESTEQVLETIQAGARASVAELGGDEVFVGMFSQVGVGMAVDGPGGGAAEVGSHIGTVSVQLVPSGERDFTSADFSTAWDANTPEIAGLESISFLASAGPGAGAAVDLELSHPDTAVLAEVSAAVTEQLRTYSDLKDVVNTYAAGKPQLDFTLLPAARTLGLTADEISRQIRSAFYGAEAVREQRGRNELKVMVRLPEAQRRSEHDIEQLEIRTPEGGFVPLSSVASFTRGQAATSIDRYNGQRVVNVSAELRQGVKSPQTVLDDLKETYLPELQAEYPALSVDFAGAQREQGEAFAALGQNYLLALFAIFALLAIPFKSYTQPAIVMSAIPFGFVGAVLGHFVMGYELSLISMFGIIALSGVVINDSLVLIDSTNRKREEPGVSAHDAIVHGGTRRLRPILLTSLTTFFGLAPMIVETSMQARFLIPMAISLGFGVLFATGIILVIVPCLYMIREDIVGFFRWLYSDDDGTPDTPELEGLPAR